jgi:hypothetical protein
MVYSDTRGKIVDYRGSHEHLAVDFELSVDDQGGLRLRSGAQRFYEGVIGFSFPMLSAGSRTCGSGMTTPRSVSESSWTSATEWGGRLFGYRGGFDVEWRRVPLGEIPNHILPLRQEQRD